MYRDDSEPITMSSKTSEPELLASAEQPIAEAEVAVGGLWNRLKLKVVETAPVMGRFMEVQAACSCASGCPTCIGATAASMALPLVTGGRHNHNIEDKES